MIDIPFENEYMVKLSDSLADLGGVVLQHTLTDSIVGQP